MLVKKNNLYSTSYSAYSSQTYIMTKTEEQKSKAKYYYNVFSTLFVDNPKPTEMDLEATKNLSESHSIGNYILKSKLGESSFSTVWKAENKITGGEVAVKQVYLSKLNKNLRNCLDCELNFLSSVNHPNIIRLLDVFEVRFPYAFE